MQLPEHDGRSAALIDIAIAAGRSTLEHFRRRDLSVDRKGDDSPVTIADRNAEQIARRMIAGRFADDSIHGEEFDDAEGSSEYRWVIDPIDGTKSFICGVPLYSTLVAIERGDQVVGGVIFIPALDEIVVAVRGGGAWTRVGDADWTRAEVSTTDDLSTATFVCSQVDSFAERGSGQGYRDLEAACRITRSWGDGYGYLLVATGRADVMVDPVCNPWDVAAVAPVVEEAGGRFTDWKGNATVRGGDGIGSNSRLHDAVRGTLGSMSET